MKLKEILGKKFNSITVLKDSGLRASNGGIILECQCDCGKIFNIPKSQLLKGQKSCGCSSQGDNLIGQKFNKLTVLEKTDKRSNGKIKWKCQCECGNITYVNTSNLKSGAVKSCGCLNGLKTLEIGKKYGKITPLKKINNFSQYECQCECGEKFIETANKILSGNKQSCGNCNKNDLKDIVIGNWKIIEQTTEKRNNYFLYKVECVKCKNIEYKTLSEIKQNKNTFCSNCRMVNIIGNKYGKLTVIEQNYNSEKRKTFCKCKCDCGNYIFTSKSNLISGNTKSCGCLKESSGEFLISSILLDNNIIFEKQKTFNECRFNNTNQLAKFDFYLPDYNCCIEYDGRQHYQNVEIFKESLTQIQERDNFKNNWCKNNNIKLIRIPYWDYSKININYLLEKIEE